jgi:hypothetical protein
MGDGMTEFLDLVSSQEISYCCGGRYSPELELCLSCFEHTHGIKIESYVSSTIRTNPDHDGQPLARSIR